MKRILIDHTETVATSKGPQIFIAGKEYETEDWIANSLVGRGKAHELHEGELSQSRDELAAMTVDQLRKIAQGKSVPEYHRLRKDQLLDALSPQTIQGEAKAESFQKIDLNPGKV